MAIFPRVIKFERFTIHSSLNKKWRHLHLNLIIPFPSLALQLFLKKRKRSSEEQIRKKKKENKQSKKWGIREVTWRKWAENSSVLFGKTQHGSKDN